MKTCKDCDYFKEDWCHYFPDHSNMFDNDWCSKLTINGERQTKIRKKAESDNLDKIVKDIVDFLKKIVDE